MQPNTATFNFYCVDDDRTSGWSNHTFILQHAFVGYGMNPEAALTEAMTAKREDYENFAVSDLLPTPKEVAKANTTREPVTTTEPLIAVRASDEHGVNLQIPIYDPAKEAAGDDD